MNLGGRGGRDARQHSRQYLRWDLPDNPADPSETTTDDLAVGIAHLIAGAVMNVAGPLFWAVTVLGLMADGLGIDLFR